MSEDEELSAARAAWRAAWRAMTPDKRIFTRHFEKAENILDAISPRGELWGGSPKSWIFRGQADSHWRLEPKAFREGIIYGGFPCYQHGLENTQHAQLLSEHYVLRQFAGIADEAGLHLPAYDEIIGPKPLQTLKTWLPDSWIELAALAQHHGVPTRLLDWTRRSLLAAYFASTEAARTVILGSASPDKTLSIYALRPDAIKQLFPQKDYLVVQVPRSRNPNLHAQSGLFTLDRQVAPRGLEGPPYRSPLNRVLMERITALDPRNPLLADVLPVLIELTLPWSEAPHLLHLLSNEGVSASSVFPGYDGVARAVEETYWARDREDVE